MKQYTTLLENRLSVTHSVRTKGLEAIDPFVKVNDKSNMSLTLTLENLQATRKKSNINYNL